MWGRTCSSCIFLDGIAEKSKATCKKCEVSVVGGFEEGSTEWVRISPASHTDLKKSTPEFMEKASVFLGYGLHSLSAGSMSLGGWMLQMPNL